MSGLLRQSCFVVACGVLALLTASMLLEPMFTGGARDGDAWGYVLVALAFAGLGLSGLAIVAQLVSEGRRGLVFLIGGYGCVLASWILIWGVLPLVYA